MTDSLRAQVLFTETKGEHDELAPLIRRLGLEVSGSNHSTLRLKVNGQQVTVFSIFNQAHEDDLDPFTTRRVRQLVAVGVRVQFEGAERSNAPSGGDAPKIWLRRETKADRTDKRTGLVRELQTGFEGFDHIVFIDNDSSEADARRVLSKEATRQAVLRLLEYDVPGVSISATAASVNLHVEREVHLEELLHTIEDLLIVARAGGPREARPSRRGENLAELMLAAAALGARRGLRVVALVHETRLAHRAAGRRGRRRHRRFLHATVLRSARRG